MSSPPSVIDMLLDDHVLECVALACLGFFAMVALYQSMKTCVLKLRLRYQAYRPADQEAQRNSNIRTVTETLEQNDNSDLEVPDRNLREGCLHARWPLNEPDEVCDLLLSRDTLRDLRIRFTPVQGDQPGLMNITMEYAIPPYQEEEPAYDLPPTYDESCELYVNENYQNSAIEAEITQNNE